MAALGEIRVVAWQPGAASDPPRTIIHVLLIPKPTVCLNRSIISRPFLSILLEMLFADLAGENPCGFQDCAARREGEEARRDGFEQR